MESGIYLRDSQDNQLEVTVPMDTSTGGPAVTDVTLEINKKRTITRSDSGKKKEINTTTQARVVIGQTNKNLRKRKVVTKAQQSSVKTRGRPKKNALPKGPVSPSKRITAFSNVKLLSPHSGWKVRFGESPEKGSKYHRSHYTANYAAAGVPPAGNPAAIVIDNSDNNSPIREVTNKVLTKRKAVDEINNDDDRLKKRKLTGRNLMDEFVALDREKTKEELLTSSSSLTESLDSPSALADGSAINDEDDILTEEKKQEPSEGQHTQRLSSSLSYSSDNIPSMFFLSQSIGDSDDAYAAKAIQYIHSSRYDQAIDRASKIKDDEKRDACYAQLAKIIAGKSSSYNQKDTTLNTLADYACRCAAQSGALRDKAYADAAIAFFANVKWDQGNEVLESSYSSASMLATAHYLLTNKSLSGIALEDVLNKIVNTVKQNTYASNVLKRYSVLKSREERAKIISSSLRAYVYAFYRNEGALSKSLRELTYGHLSEQELDLIA